MSRSVFALVLLLLAFWANAAAQVASRGSARRPMTLRASRESLRATAAAPTHIHRA
jgi:hypothetical protein